MERMNLIIAHQKEIITQKDEQIHMLKSIIKKYDSSVWEQ